MSIPPDRRLAAPREAWLCLALALVAQVFASGRLAVAAAAWLAPVLWLRFLRARPAAPGLAFAYAGIVAAGALSFRKVIPVDSAALEAAVILVSSVFLWLPYAADRLLAARLGSTARLAVLPAAWVVAEWTLGALSPYGTWGSLAYTQLDVPVAQAAAVAGMYAIPFLVALAAATVNGLWEEWRGEGFRDAALRRSAAPAAVLAIAFAFGAWRLAGAADGGESARLAGVTVPWKETLARLQGDRVAGDRLSAEGLVAVREETRALQRSLLEATRREARAGAKLVAWSELNGIVFGEDEAALVDAGRALAREEGIHLVMALAVVRPGERLRENKLVAVDPAGAVVAGFHKARPVPGEPERPGDGRMPVFETPLGRVGLAICFDLDFPAFVRQAGLAGVDLLVAPAADWAEVEAIHSTMARLRAIDSGVNLLRQANWGISAAVDTRGRVRARMDHFRSHDLTLVAQLPTRRAAVLAPRLGDSLPAACALALLGLAAAPLRGRAGARTGATPSPVPQAGAARG